MISNKKILILIGLFLWPTFGLAQTTSPWEISLAPIKTEWQQIRAKRTASYGQMMIKNLMFSQERSRDIYNGVLEKIADQATSSQKSLLIGEMTEIGTILNRNQAAIDKLKVSLEPQNSAKTTWQETRLSVRSIINDLRLVHKKIKGVLKLLD